MGLFDGLKKKMQKGNYPVRVLRIREGDGEPKFYLNRATRVTDEDTGEESYEFLDYDRDMQAFDYKELKTLNDSEDFAIVYEADKGVFDKADFSGKFEITGEPEKHSRFLEVKDKIKRKGDALLRKVDRKGYLVDESKKEEVHEEIEALQEEVNELRKELREVDEMTTVEVKSEDASIDVAAMEKVRSRWQMQKAKDAREAWDERSKLEKMMPYIGMIVTGIFIVLVIGVFSMFMKDVTGSMTESANIMQQAAQSLQQAQ